MAARGYDFYLLVLKVSFLFAGLELRTNKVPTVAGHKYSSHSIWRRLFTFYAR